MAKGSVAGFPPRDEDEQNLRAVIAEVLERTARYPMSTTSTDVIRAVEAAGWRFTHD